MSETATTGQSAQHKKRLTVEDIVTNEKALEKDYSSGHKLKARNGKLPFLLLVFTVCGTLIAVFVYASGAYALSNLRAEYMEQRLQYEDISKRLVEVEAEASQLLITCAVSVSDEDLCTVLLDKLEAAEGVNLTDPGKIDPYDALAEELRGAIDSLRTINQKAETAHSELTAAIKAVHDDSSTKTREDFDRALKDGAQLVEEAGRRVEETNGQVRDDGLRTRVSAVADSLHKKIDEARKADDGSLREYTSLTTQIDDLIQELRDALANLDTDHQLWTEQQRLIASQTQQGTGNTTNNGENQVPPNNGQNNPDNNSNEDNPPPDNEDTTQ